MAFNREFGNRSLVREKAYMACEKGDGLRKYSKVGVCARVWLFFPLVDLEVYLVQHSLHDLSLLAFIFYSFFFFCSYSLTVRLFYAEASACLGRVVTRV